MQFIDNIFCVFYRSFKVVGFHLNTKFRTGWSENSFWINLKQNFNKGLSLSKDKFSSLSSVDLHVFELSN